MNLVGEQVHAHTYIHKWLEGKKIAKCKQLVVLNYDDAVKATSAKIFFFSCSCNRFSFFFFAVALKHAHTTHTHTNESTCLLFGWIVHSLSLCSIILAPFFHCHTREFAFRILPFCIALHLIAEILWIFAVMWILPMAGKRRVCMTMTVLSEWNIPPDLIVPFSI